MFTNILFPTDGSDAANQAAEVLATLIQGDPKIRVTCAVGITPIDPGETDLEAEVVSAQNAHARERALRVLEQVAGIFKRRDIDVRTSTLEGKPISAAIAQEVEAGVYEAVVMGSRGMGLQKGDLDYFGSVTEHVIRRVSVPVIVIPVRSS